MPIGGDLVTATAATKEEARTQACSLTTDAAVIAALRAYADK